MQTIVVLPIQHPKPPQLTSVAHPGPVPPGRVVAAGSGAKTGHSGPKAALYRAQQVSKLSIAAASALLEQQRPGQLTTQEVDGTVPVRVTCLGSFTAVGKERVSFDEATVTLVHHQP